MNIQLDSYAEMTSSFVRTQIGTFVTGWKRMRDNKNSAGQIHDKQSGLQANEKSYDYNDIGMPKKRNETRHGSIHTHIHIK